MSSLVLGVGHFVVPPDVTPSKDVIEASWDSIPTVVVPHGVAAVPRRSPIKARKRTPWRAQAEAERVIERADSHEWLDERLFVEPKHRHLRLSCTTSAMLHAVLVILVLLFVTWRTAGADPAPLAVERSAKIPALPRPAPQRAPAVETPAAAPLESPSRIEAEVTSAR